jgi:uncharacterized membrane protein
LSAALYFNFFSSALFTNDAVVLALLFLSLGLVFYTSSLDNVFWKRFYNVCPPLLLCYFIPALFNYPLGMINGEESKLYGVAKDYFLPASLILLCLSMDIKSLAGLGPKALIMFFTTVVAVIIGGPIAIYISKLLMPDTIALYGQDLWKGMSTIAGSWIGGSANQTAMKEIYDVPQDLFGTMLVIDVVAAYVWMAILLFGASKSSMIDKWLKADASSLVEIKEKGLVFRSRVARIPSTEELVILLSLVFVVVGVAHFAADLIVPRLSDYTEYLKSIRMTAFLSKFFWIVVIATTIGIVLSLTKARNYEGIGASKIGTIFIYILVTTIGMQMNLKAVLSNISLLWVGLIWMMVHIVIIIAMARIVKAPFFFLAVGSQACIGGPASAPIVASAFDPALAPIGVILAVFGYAIGTYGAILCAQLMSLV